jgi:hypothetical protein
LVLRLARENPRRLELLVEQSHQASGPEHVRINALKKIRMLVAAAGNHTSRRRGTELGRPLRCAR